MFPSGMGFSNSQIAFETVQRLSCYANAHDLDIDYVRYKSPRLRILPMFDWFDFGVAFFQMVAIHVFHTLELKDATKS